MICSSGSSGTATIRSSSSSGTSGYQLTLPRACTFSEDCIFLLRGSPAVAAYNCTLMDTGRPVSGYTVSPSHYRTLAALTACDSHASSLLQSATLFSHLFSEACVYGRRSHIPPSSLLPCRICCLGVCSSRPSAFRSAFVLSYGSGQMTFFPGILTLAFLLFLVRDRSRCPDALELLPRGYSYFHKCLF